MPPPVPAGTIAAFATIEPSREFKVDTVGCACPKAKRSESLEARRDHCDIESKGLSDGRNATGIRRDGKRTETGTAGKIRRAERSGSSLPWASVHRPARRQWIKQQSRIPTKWNKARIGEIAIDVDDHIGGIGDVDTDRPIGSSRNDRCVRNDLP